MNMRSLLEKLVIASCESSDDDDDDYNDESGDGEDAEDGGNGGNDDATNRAKPNWQMMSSWHRVGPRIRKRQQLQRRDSLGVAPRPGTV